jgi:dTDP-4-amino-4,6-dideoxygalactose transaminase
MTMNDAIPFMRLDRQFQQHREAFLAAMMPVLESGAVLQSPAITAFEQKLAAAMGSRNAIAVGSGTDAMLHALLALGLREGTRVAVPALTFVASASCILHARCIPVFVDVDPMTGLADEAALLDLVESGAVDAVVAVHLYGQMQPLERVGEACRRRGISIIEDAAQALGATRHGVAPGKAGRLAALSFDPMKVIGAFGSGGALVTDDDELAARLRQLRYHGHDGKGRYLLPGFNNQMHSIQAAMLSVKLDHMMEWQARRTAIAAAFDEDLAQLPGLRRLPVLPGNVHNFHKYVVWADERETVRQRLSALGVQTKVHYEVPLHRQPLFAPGADCPAADAACAHVLSLPMYPELTDEEVARIGSAVRRVLQEAASA